MTSALLQSATVLPRRCANSRRPGIHPSSLARRGVFRWNAGAVDDGAGAADEVDSIDRPQPQQSTSFSRYSVLVKRPLGLVLETDSQGDIFVVEVVGECVSALAYPAHTGPSHPDEMTPKQSYIDTS